MSKFVFYTDLHLASQAPCHRVDSWSETLIEKLAEVYRIAESSDCDFLVFGGDFFDKHRIYSYDVINAAMDIVCGCSVKTYGIIGQHDLLGYNPATFRTSAYAFLANRCSQFEIIREPVTVGNVNLYASHVWDDLKAATAERKDGAFHVLVAHHLLTDSKKPFQTNDTGWFGRRSSFDLVLSGDLHCGYSTHKTAGTLFCNPGSLARRAVNDINRMPSVAMVVCEDEMPSPSVALLQLKCGKKGEDVFSQTVMEVVREMSGDKDRVCENELRCDMFARRLEAFEKESGSIHELIQKAGREFGVREEILNYLDMKKT